jgi:hypothetical protein
MQLTILARRAALVLLLASPAARGQTEGAPPPPAPPVPLARETVIEPPPVLPPPEQDRQAAADPASLAGGGANVTGPFGFGGPGGAFNPQLLSIPRASLATTWFPSERVSNQPTNLGFLREDLFVSVPVYSDGCDTWALSFRGRNETFSTQAILPLSERRFPEDLWALNFAATYAHRFDSEVIVGGTLSVGSASDKPFHSIDEMTLGVSAFAWIPSGERNAWLFSVAYSPTAEINFPIPMVAYIYNPSDYLRINIGLPFQIMYRPTEDLRLDFSYMLLRNVHAQATYRLCRPVSVFAAFDWENESYFLADRQNVNDRLFYYDKRLSAGLIFNVTRCFSVTLSGGYTFDRFYFEGAQYSDKNTNQVNVGDGPYLSLQGRLRW